MPDDGLRIGDVVYADFTANFDNDEVKSRRGVVLQIGDDPQLENDECLVVAVSSKLDLGNPYWFVEMPFSSNPAQRCTTSFREKCAAKVFWYEKKRLADCNWAGAVPLLIRSELDKKSKEFNSELAKLGTRGKILAFQKECANYFMA